MTEKTLPLLDRIFVEITNACNLSCSFCKPSSRPARFMDRGLFEKIIDQGRFLAREVVLHVLGEPLLHPDLGYFIDTARAAGMSVMITTNGTMLGQDAGAMLAHKNIRKINISMHAAPPGEGHHEYCQEVFNFTDQVSTFSPDTLVHLRLWNAFSQESGQTVKAINAHYATAIKCPSQPKECGPRQKKSLRKKLSLHFDPLFSWPDIRGPLLYEKGYCHGLSTHFGVLSDGTVIPCCLDAEGIISLGQVQEQPLSEILSQGRAAAMKQGFQSGRLTEDLCRRCGYINRFKAR